MPRSVRLTAHPRFNNSPLCVSCQWRLAAPAFRLSQLQQNRWITQNHIRKIKEAMADWEERAKAIKKGEKQSMLSLLEERGYVHQIIGARDDLDNMLTERRIGAYVGVDPTAPSLHVGHMVPFMALGWLFIHGYAASFLLGGTTARIGDPTDRTTSRETQHRTERKAYMANMHIQLKKLGASIESYAGRKGYVREWAWRRALVNNSTWYQKLPVTDFIRVLGSQVRMGPLLGRDTVKNRLESGTGMSFAEFAYPLLQGWDWWELFKKGTQLQIGGADQFGNILAGVEAVKAMKKVEPVQFEIDGHTQGHVGSTLTAALSNLPKDGGNINEPMGFTVPLLTTSAGVKFGKSADNAVWLDQQSTSTFDLYQFFVRTADADVEKYLKLFTFLPISEIRALMDEHRLDESKRIAQHKLAFEFVELVHGLKAAQSAEQQHKVLFVENISIDSLRANMSPANSAPETGQKDGQPPGEWSNSLNKYAPPAHMEDAPSVHARLPRSLVVGQPIHKVFWSAGLVSSKTEGVKLVANKGCHIGSKTGRGAVNTKMGDQLAFTPVTSSHASETEKYIIDGDILILRIGKWKIKIIKIVSDKEFEEAGLTCPGWKEDHPRTQDYKTKEYKIEQEEISKFRAEKKQKRLERIERQKGRGYKRVYLTNK